MSLNEAAKNLMLDELRSSLVFLSLHTDDPGTSGINEVSGGSPAYARKAVTWNAAAAGAIDTSNQPVFDVPAATVKYIGYWTAVTAGTFYGAKAVTNEVFAAQGNYTVTDGDIDLNATPA